MLASRPSSCSTFLMPPANCFDGSASAHRNSDIRRWQCGQLSSGSESTDERLSRCEKSESDEPTSAV